MSLSLLYPATTMGWRVLYPLMAIYKLVRTQHIHAPLADVWNFFSNPANLAKITPGYMNFRVTSEPHTGSIYAGQVITYKVSPIAGIPLSWMTEITHVEPMRMFVDEQRHGPYKMWRHQHFFEEQGDTVLMTDVVHYKLPLGFLGNAAHTLFVKKQLNDIFSFRRKVIDEAFPVVNK